MLNNVIGKSNICNLFKALKKKRLANTFFPYSLQLKMKKLFPLFVILLMTFNSYAQCEFPFNSGTRQFTDAILYSGTIAVELQPDSSVIYRIDPSKLSLKKNETFPTRLQLAPTGQWYFKWNFATTPNHWRPMNMACDQSSIKVKFAPSDFPNGGKIECDFFYLDPVNKVSAGFMGSVATRILFGSNSKPIK